jgi:hypothetical protein
MYHDDEFFYEPSEFDQQVNEFKLALMNSVKDEFKTEMERLRNENEELQRVKRDWESIQKEYANKHRQLEYDKSQLERTVRWAKLGELMKELNVTLYKAVVSYTEKPKCSKCNEKRQIEFTSPSGKLMGENCECATKNKNYVPEGNIMSEMRSRDGKITAWYKNYRDSDEGLTLSTSTVVSKIYDQGMPFESIERYGMFFRDKEDCQKYCDWLNENNPA